MDISEGALSFATSFSLMHSTTGEVKGVCSPPEDIMPDPFSIRMKPHLLKLTVFSIQDSSSVKNKGIRYPECTSLPMVTNSISFTPVGYVRHFQSLLISKQLLRIHHSYSIADQV
ncbi:hypothetical protein D3C71_1403390 [compost metagenome]